VASRDNPPQPWQRGNKKLGPVWPGGLRAGTRGDKVMAWKTRVYVKRHSAGLEQAWAAAGIHYLGFGNNDRGAWYRVRFDRAAEALQIAQRWERRPRLINWMLR